MNKKFNNTGVNWVLVLLKGVLFGICFFVLVIGILHPWFSGTKIFVQGIMLGGLELRYYGILMSGSILAGYWWAYKTRERAYHDFTASHLDHIVLICLVFGFIGARAYHVISQYGLYLEHPWQMFAVWQGGLSIYGAAIGGVLALLWYARRNSQLSFWKLVDWLTPSVILGQIIGRFGNFVNYELYGKPTELWWKMYVPESWRSVGWENFHYFHPLFLYESTIMLVLFYILIKGKFRTGEVFLWWILVYNIARFCLEFLRIDSVMYGGVRVNAVVSLVLATTSIILLYRRKKDEQQTT